MKQGLSSFRTIDLGLNVMVDRVFRVLVINKKKTRRYQIECARRVSVSNKSKGPEQVAKIG